MSVTPFAPSFFGIRYRIACFESNELHSTAVGIKDLRTTGHVVRVLRSAAKRVGKTDVRGPFRHSRQGRKLPRYATCFYVEVNAHAPCQRCFVSECESAVIDHLCGNVEAGAKRLDAVVSIEPDASECDLPRSGQMDESHIELITHEPQPVQPVAQGVHEAHRWRAIGS
jgi:hypothetical protein